MENSINLHEQIYRYNIIDDLLNSLSYNQFIKNKSILQEQIEIDYDLVRKAIWFASILANSKDEKHIRKVQNLASLLFLNYRNNIDIAKTAYVLLSRTGNLIATKFFDNLFDQNKDIVDRKFIVDFDFTLDLELSNAREQSIINIADESYLTTRFQQRLWDSLIKRDNISISAPTSSGKSFVIKKYVKNILREKRDARILYIVPSRALINQVSDEFRVDLNSDFVELKTAFVENIELTNIKNVIYILTPERCLKLLQYSWKNQFQLDVIFVDEIQHSEDESGRGTLLEYVLRELAIINYRSQIICAGPNIINAKDLYYRLFGMDNIEIQTTVSPVFQLKSIVKIEKTGINIELKVENYISHFKLLSEDNVVRAFKSSIGDGLPSIINLLSAGGQNIVYSPRTDYAEMWALKFVRSINREVTTDKEILDLIDFLKEEIHPKYYLIECLEKKVAFHHGKLPDIIRKEIEELFINGKIIDLFCTSTLIEGVNLPANNLFVITPKKRHRDLTMFEFGNLIGRAGRIRDSLYGTIYAIQINEKDWPELYFDNDYNKEVVTVSEKVLVDLDDLKNKLKLPLTDIKSDKEKNTIIFLRHKAIRSELEFKSYLHIKKVNPNEIESLLNLLRDLANQINIPTETLRLNPTIDPVLQDNLYREILRTGITQWLIIINSNFNAKIYGNNQHEYKHENTNFYWQLVNITENLDKHFNIGLEAFTKQNVSISIRQMCFYGIKWLRNSSYSELINSDIKFYARHRIPSKRIDPNDTDKINEIINNIIDIHSKIISYLMVKYFKLLNDILYSIMSDEEKEKYSFALSIPIMLELGTSEPEVIQLISAGISRSVALKVFSVFRKVKNYESLNIFEWLSQQESLGLKAIYERYLKKIKLLNSGSDGIELRDILF